MVGADDYIAVLRGDVHLLMRDIGWDPIFEYEGKTYAEMEKEEKVGRSRVFGNWSRRQTLKSHDQNRISHRYKALVKIQQWLAEGQQ